MNRSVCSTEGSSLHWKYHVLLCVCVCVCVAYVGKMPQCIRTLVFDTYNVRYGVSSLKSWQKCESRGSVNRRRWRTGDSIHEDSCETSSDSARECLRVRVHSTYEIRDKNTKEEEKKTALRFTAILEMDFEGCDGTQVPFYCLLHLTFWLQFSI